MTLQTTTFKGARYLVKFHDPIEWADTESYEAIEAVKHNAYTYISKQPVPTGVQIDNTDFWLLWADPNAQMEELRQLVAGYVDDVETLQITVGSQSNDIGAIQNALPISAFSSENTVKNYIDSQTANAILINPDTFEGTDSQKLAQAMDEAGTTANATIIINRMYSLSEDLKIKHSAETNGRLIFMGIGENCGIDCNEFSIAPYDYSASYGMCSFMNLIFSGTGYAIDVQFLIRLNFIGCSFENFESVFHVIRYMQSFYMMQCTFRYIDNYVVLTQTENNPNSSLYDVQFTQCLVEKCGGFIYSNRIYGTFINQCCIEGLFRPVIKLVGLAKNLSIDNNYFEANNNGEYLPDGMPNGNGLTFDFTEMVDYNHNVTITNNRFGYNSGNVITQIKYDDLQSGCMFFSNNHLNLDDITFIKAPDSRNTPYKNYIVNGVQGVDLKPDAHVFNDMANNLTPRSFVANTDLNVKMDTGVYVKTSGVTLQNAPAIGSIFAMINIVFTNTSIYQIAWNSDYIAFRYGLTYPWKILPSA